jgi:hypothetical protein
LLRLLFWFVSALISMLVQTAGAVVTVTVGFSEVTESPSVLTAATAFNHQKHGFP